MNALWLEYVRVFWPVLGGVGALVSVVAVLWLRTKFAPIEEHRGLGERVATLESRVTGHGERLNGLDAYTQQAPTRQELQDDIAKLAERMAGIESGVKGMGKELATSNAYLHTLIEQGLKK